MTASRVVVWLLAVLAIPGLILGWQALGRRLERQASREREAAGLRSVEDEFAPTIAAGQAFSTGRHVGRVPVDMRARTGGRHRASEDDDTRPLPIVTVRPAPPGPPGEVPR